MKTDDPCAATDEQCARRPGRPRSTRTHLAILDAALEQLVACGYQGMSMEAIAERAGTSKATIYRWWTSKEELLVEALETRRPSLAFEPTGAPREDLERLLTMMVERLPPRAQSTIARLVGAMADSAELAEMLSSRHGGHRKAALMDLVRAAVDAGELDPDLDVELACDQLVGPVLYRHLVTGDPVDADLARALVADLWAAHGITSKEQP